MKYRISLTRRGMKYYTHKSKEWKKLNPNKVKKSWTKYNQTSKNIINRQNYYQKNKDKISEQKRLNYHKNIEKYQKQKRVYYLKNKTEIQKKTSKYYQTWKTYNKYLAVFHYTNGKMCCETCGETIMELLTVDHINGGGSKHRKLIGSRNIHVWLRRNNYPTGFQILCYNCNMVKQRVTKKRYDEIIYELRQRNFEKEVI